MTRKTRSELDKWAEVYDEWTGIDLFLDWLGESKIAVCKLSEDGFENYLMVRYDIQRMYYDYCDIDPAKLEQERRALLEEASKQ